MDRTVPYRRCRQRGLTRVAAVAIAVGAALVNGGCSKEPSVEAEGEAARAAVEAFVEAGKRGDRQAFIDLLSAEDREAARDPEWIPMIAENPDLQYVVGGAIVDGDVAAVHLQLLEETDLQPLDVLLAKEGGSWKVRETATLERLADEWRRRLLPNLERMLGSDAPGETAPLDLDPMRDTLEDGPDR